MSKEEKNKIKEYQKKKYQELIQYKKEALKNKLINLPVHNIIMGEKTLKFNNTKINKKEFHKSNQATDLDSVDTNKIVVSDKLRIVKKVLNNSLAIKKMKLLSHYVLSYLK